MNIVKELRKKAGIQQKELAIIIGCSRPIVSEWESNKKDPSGERLKKLAEYFGVDELVILGKGVVDLNEKPYVAESKKEDSTAEAEQIVQYVIDRLSELKDAPLQKQETPEIHIVSTMMEQMTKEQQEQVVNVVRALYANKKG